MGLKPTNFNSLGFLTIISIVSVLVIGTVVALDGTIRFPLVMSPFSVYVPPLSVAVFSVPTIAVLASVNVPTWVGIEPEAKPVARTSSSTKKSFVVRLKLLRAHVTQKPKKVSETAIPSEIAAKP